MVCFSGLTSCPTSHTDQIESNYVLLLISKFTSHMLDEVPEF